RRIDLREFLLRGRDRGERGIEQNRAGRGRALIDGEKIIRHARPLRRRNRGRPRSRTGDRISYRRGAGRRPAGPASYEAMFRHSFAAIAAEIVSKSDFVISSKPNLNG